MTKPLDIPTIADRSRILNAHQTAELFGLSLSHFRRLYRAKKLPSPIKIGERKLGWQLGVATDFIASKAAEAA